MTFRIIVLTSLLIATFCAYSIGLGGAFQFDDTINITENPKFANVKLELPSLYEATVSGNAGILKRPISMFTFALNAATTGLAEPYYFKLTNLFIHLFNGVLVYIAFGLLLSGFRERRGNVLLTEQTIAWMQLVATAIWLLHPLNLTSVLYVVQRMTSISATFTFAALIFYAVGRDCMDKNPLKGWLYVLSAVGLCGGLASLSKENGVLVPLLLLVAEATVWQFQTKNQKNRRGLIALFSLTVLLPAALVCIALMANVKALFSGYSVRDFDMLERLLTESRVIFLYLRLFFAPATSVLGLYHDDLVVSRGVWDPPITALSLAGIALLFAVALLCMRRAPIVSFGILWFLAGHSMESTILPLELVHEHRNYVPIFGMSFTLAFLLCVETKTLWVNRLKRAAAVVCIFLFAITTALRAQQWSDPVVHSTYEAKHHPQSERALQQFAQMQFAVYLTSPTPAALDSARSAYQKLMAIPSNSNAVYFGRLQLDQAAGLPLDTLLLGELRSRLEKRVLLPNTTSAFRALLDCQYFSYCRIPDAEIVSLLQAAVTNPAARGGTGETLAIFLAQYYVDKMGDLGAGKTAILNGLNRTPTSAPLNIALARIYRLAGELDSARKALAEAERLDAWRERALEIKEVTLLLEKSARESGKS